jgi:hypothetical protein
MQSNNIHISHKKSLTRKNSCIKKTSPEKKEF